MQICATMLKSLCQSSTTQAPTMARTVLVVELQAQGVQSDKCLCISHNALSLDST